MSDMYRERMHEALRAIAISPVTHIVCALAVLVSFVYWFPFTVDDAWITFRYGKTFVETGIWSWNPGYDDSGIAYTNALFALMSVLPHVFGIPVALFFKLLAFASAVWLMWVAGKEAGAEARGWLLLGLAATPVFAVHLVSGLESGIYVVVLVRLAIALRSIRIAPDAWVSLGMLPLLRPEGFLFSLVFAALFVRKEGVRAGLPWLGGIGAVWLCYFGASMYRFGTFLPNSVFVKSVSGSHLFLIKQYLFAHVWLVLASVYAAALAWKRDRAIALVVGMLVAVGVLLYGSATLQMDNAARFAFQSFGAAALIALVGIPARRYLYLPLLIGLLSTTPILLAESHFLSHYDWSSRRTHKPVGELFSRVIPESTIALGDAGILPYHSHNSYLDLVGLANARVAHEGVTTAFLEETKPTVFILYSRTAQEEGIVPVHGQERALAYAREHGFESVGAIQALDGTFLVYLMDAQHPKKEAVRTGLAEIAHEAAMGRYSWWASFVESSGL